jgi:hypothetical protein
MIVSAVVIVGGLITWHLWPEQEIPSPSPVVSPTSTSTPTPTPTPDPIPTPDPYIKVISPNGGEEWKEGRTHTIEWKSDGVDKVNISYTLPADFGVNYIVENISAALGSYIWDVNIPDTIIFGAELPGEYEIQISSADDGVFVNDESDNYFSIVAKDETADWKIYTNEEYGFEFKYPEDLGAKEIPTSKPTGLNISLDKGDIVVQEINNSIINIDLPEDCIFNSSTLEEEKMLSFVSTKKANGIDFYYYKNYPEYIGGYCGMSTGCWYKDIYRTFYNDHCYQIVYNRSNRSFIEGNPYDNPKIIGDVKEVPEIFDQILSTFKFID